MAATSAPTASGWVKVTDALPFGPFVLIIVPPPVNPTFRHDILAHLEQPARHAPVDRRDQRVVARAAKPGCSRVATG